MNSRVVITGAGGMLARAMGRVFSERGAAVTPLTKQDLDVTNEADVRRTISDLRPQIIIQCAAYTRVDDAENDYETAYAINATATEIVAETARTMGARLIYPSTDYVFDGRASTPYSASHPVSPINAYGRTKAAGETAAERAGDFLVLRTSWLYGAGGRNFVRAIAERARRGEGLRVVGDQTGAPTSTATLAAAAYHLATFAPSGTYHITNSGQTTWHEFAQMIVRQLRLTTPIEKISTSDFPTTAKRPAYSVLDCSETERFTGTLDDWGVALGSAISSGDY